MRFFLDQDNNCHWYIVDASKRKEWSEWLELSEDDENSWNAPSFAQELGGHPNRVEFGNDFKNV